MSKVKFSSIEELEERYGLTPLNQESEKEINKLLDEEVALYFDENDKVWTEANVYIANLKNM